MRHWEDVESLTSVLDRHAKAIHSHGTSDWGIHWALAAYIEFLNSEPLLRDLLVNFVNTARGTNEVAVNATGELFSRAVKIVEDRPDLGPLPTSVPRAWADLEALVAGLLSNLGEGIEGKEGADGVALQHLLMETNALGVNLRRIEETLPGSLYLRLVRDSGWLRVQKLDDAEMLALWIGQAQRLVGNIDDSANFPGDDRLSQPALVQISRSVERLNLAIVTALSRGASRKAVVQRFAARCTSFDRNRIIAELLRRDEDHGVSPKTPEAWLTLQFAQYLFDAGYNPLVDATECGLRPDVFDPSMGNALYVEAKQYKKVAGGTRKKLAEDVAQTLNTWARLATKWRVPEAFLLVFRRSGAHLEFESNEVRTPRGVLRIEIVDLAGPEESGSRTKKVVTIRTEDLLQKRGIRADGKSEAGEP